MKIGRPTSSITTEERAKVANLPAVPNSYLEIPEFDIEPAVGEEGEMYRNTVSNKFFLVKDAAWVECLFSLEEIVP